MLLKPRSRRYIFETKLFILIGLPLHYLKATLAIEHLISKHLMFRIEFLTCGQQLKVTGWADCLACLEKKAIIKRLKLEME